MTTWTWMIYMATNNDAEFAGEQCIVNIETAVAKAAANSTANNVRVLIQQATSTGSVRRIIGAKPEIVSDLGQVDSGDSATMLDFVCWAAATAPAQRYALIIWSHGSGWQPDETAQPAATPPPAVVIQPQVVSSTQPMPLAPLPSVEPQPTSAVGSTNFTRGIPLSALEAAHPVPTTSSASETVPGDGSSVLFSSTKRRILELPTKPERAIAFDDGTGHSLDTIELGNVMKGVMQILGQPVDLLGMNACLMSSIEVAYQMRSYARLYVGSEKPMPDDGWPHGDILSGLMNQSDIDTISLGKLVIEKYCAYFSLSGPHAVSGTTLTALQLAGIEHVASAVGAFANALQKGMGTQSNATWKAQRATLSCGFQLYDLMSFCRALIVQPGVAAEIVTVAQAVCTVLADPAFLIEFGHVDQQDTAGGVSTYLMQPHPGKRISPSYAETDYAKATGWGAFLAAYHTAFGC